MPEGDDRWNSWPVPSLVSLSRGSPVGGSSQNNGPSYSLKTGEKLSRLGSQPSAPALQPQTTGRANGFIKTILAKAYVNRLQHAD